MDDVEIVVVKNVRYRRPDAERLGLVAPVGEAGATKPKTGASAKPKGPTTTK